MMKKRFFVVSTVLLISALAWAGTANTGKDEANTAAFAKFKNLVGQWEAESEKGKVTSSYELLSNGTALVEHVNVPGESPMLTVYYLEGNPWSLRTIARPETSLTCGLRSTTVMQTRFDSIS